MPNTEPKPIAFGIEQGIRYATFEREELDAFIRDTSSTSFVVRKPNGEPFAVFYINEEVRRELNARR